MSCNLTRSRCLGISHPLRAVLHLGGRRERRRRLTTGCTLRVSRSVARILRLIRRRHWTRSRPIARLRRIGRRCGRVAPWAWCLRRRHRPSCIRAYGRRIRLLRLSGRRYTINDRWIVVRISPLVVIMSRPLVACVSCRHSGISGSADGPISGHKLKRSLGAESRNCQSRGKDAHEYTQEKKRLWARLLLRWCVGFLLPGCFGANFCIGV